MKLEYTQIGSSFYHQAVLIRKEQFFKNMKNGSDLINDAYENSGIHLVCVDEKIVVGTGRLNIVNDAAVISQMAVPKARQYQNIGSKILKELIDFCMNKKLKIIELSARETALEFYKKFNFEAVGQSYPSIKTGVIHQKMELKLV